MLAVNGNGGLILYRGNGAGHFLSPYPQIGSGWGSFTALLATDWSGDGKPDLLARKSDGGLLMYRGNAPRRLRDRHGGDDRQRLGRLHGAAGARRLQRRRQEGHPRPPVRRLAAALPR